VRNLSTTFIDLMRSQETTDGAILLITIDHEDLGSPPLYFSNDPTTRHTETPLVYKTVSRGEDYFFVPMKISLPSEPQDGAPQASITISNVGQEIIELIRSVLTPASVTIEVVLASDPDTVEITFPTFDLTSVDYDASDVNLTLTIDSMAAEPYPAGAFTPGAFPTLF